MAHKTPEERFYAKVQKAGPNGCHIWIGAKNVWGYGRLHRGGKHHAAHRVIWEMVNGPIPDGLCVLHHCDNRRCVNPTHLFLGTLGDNMRDMLMKNRAAWQQPGYRRPDEPPRDRPRRQPGVRFEFHLPVERRLELDRLAEQTGMSASDIARLGIRWILDNQAVLLKPEAPHAPEL
jgi:hypothetical protein